MLLAVIPAVFPPPAFALPIALASAVVGFVPTSWFALYRTLCGAESPFAVIDNMVTVAVRKCGAPGFGLAGLVPLVGAFVVLDAAVYEWEHAGLVEGGSAHCPAGCRWRRRWWRRRCWSLLRCRADFISF